MSVKLSRVKSEASCRCLLLVHNLKDVGVPGWSLSLPLCSAGVLIPSRWAREHSLGTSWGESPAPHQMKVDWFPHPMHLFFPVLWMWIFLGHWLAFPELHEESPGGAKQCLPPGHLRLKKSLLAQKGCEIRNESLWQPFKGMYLCSVFFKALVKSKEVSCGQGTSAWWKQGVDWSVWNKNVHWNKKEMFIFLFPFLSRSFPLPPHPQYLSQLHQL